MTPKMIGTLFPLANWTHCTGGSSIASYGDFLKALRLFKIISFLWKVWLNFQAHHVPLPASTNCWCFSLQGCIFDNTDVIYWAHFVVACKNGQFAIYNFHCFSQVLWSWESQKPLTNVSSWKVRAAQECQRTWLASSLSQSKSLDFIILNFNNF